MWRMCGGRAAACVAWGAGGRPAAATFCEVSPPLPQNYAAQKMKTSKPERRKVKNGIFEGEQVKLNCAVCKKDFWTRASHEERRQYCSLKCRKNAPTVRKAERMAALMERESLTPAQSAKIRSEIASYIGDQLTDAHQVVMGIKTWNPTQARVFGMLLNKVVPDLNAAYVQHEHTTKSVTDLSREELEAIAQGISTIEVEFHEVSTDEDN